MREVGQAPRMRTLAAAIVVSMCATVFVAACAPRPTQTIVVAPPGTTTVTTTTVTTTTVVSTAGVAATETPVFKVGDRVAAQRKGVQYLGTIQSVKGNTAEVIFADTQKSASYRLVALRLVKPYVWKLGASVAAVRGVARFYEGDVIATKAGDLYTIKWDDGAKPSDVSADKIMAPSR